MLWPRFDCTSGSSGTWEGAQLIAADEAVPSCEGKSAEAREGGRRTSVISA